MLDSEEKELPWCLLIIYYFPGGRKRATRLVTAITQSREARHHMCLQNRDAQFCHASDGKWECIFEVVGLIEIAGRGGWR